MDILIIRQTLDTGDAITTPHAPAPPVGGQPSGAVIGSGVAGIATTYLVDCTHTVALFEVDDRLGNDSRCVETATDDAGASAVTHAVTLSATANTTPLGVT